MGPPNHLMENDMMIHALSSIALIQSHPQGVPLEIQEVIRKIRNIFEIVTSKVAKDEVLGGLDR